MSIHTRRDQTVSSRRLCELKSLRLKTADNDSVHIADATRRDWSVCELFRLLKILLKIPADCRRLSSHRPTWRNSTVSSRRPCDMALSDEGLTYHLIHRRIGDESFQIIDCTIIEVFNTQAKLVCDHIKQIHISDADATKLQSSFVASASRRSLWIESATRVCRSLEQSEQVADGSVASWIESPTVVTKFTIRTSVIFLEFVIN